MTALKFWGQEIEETNSGKTWKVFIKKAFWNNTIGLNKLLVDEAVKKFERRIEISCLTPDVKFTLPAWKIKLSYPLKEFVYRFADRPMKMYMIPIPREKLEEADGADS